MLSVWTWSVARHRASNRSSIVRMAVDDLGYDGGRIGLRIDVTGFASLDRRSADRAALDAPSRMENTKQGDLHFEWTKRILSAVSNPSMNLCVAADTDR